MKLRLITLAFISVFFLTAASAKKKTTAPVNDRQQWVELCYRIAAPVLEKQGRTSKKHATRTQPHLGRT